MHDETNPIRRAVHLRPDPVHQQQVLLRGHWPGRSADECLYLVENKIETNGLTCHIYTLGRIGAAGWSVLGGITGVVRILSAASIALHNLATYNPDYEIEKYPFNNKIIVTYKK